MRRAAMALWVATCFVPAVAHAQHAMPSAEVHAKVQARLRSELHSAGLRYGAPVLLRVFKHSGELEVWVRDAMRFRLFRTYPICHWSGTLGPKAWEGDHQSPEGFYGIDRGALRERPQYHFGLDLGYPNAYDRAHGYDGANLLVHGGCYSVGCYAMGNAAIDEIHYLVDAALAGGQTRVDVHAFPFRFDAPPRRDWRQLGWGAFWAELEPAYVQFNRSGQAPVIRVVDGHYIVAPENDEARRSGPRTGTTARAD